MKALFNELPQFADGNGAPYAGGLLFFYVAGSSTKLNTYQDSAGTVAHQNPIVLDSAGRPAVGIFGTGSYKIVLAPSTDTDPPTSPIWTLDNIEPINEFTATVDQWGASVTATYVSGTQFTVLGDQTSTFHAGRRIKVTDAGGTKYGVITASSFGASTTVTVSLDSGTLSSPITSVNLSLLTASSHAVPVGPVVSPSQITADQNNWSPSGIADAKVLRISADARRSITGILAGSDAREVVIHNVGTFPILFKYESGSSSAANRFAFAHTLSGGHSMRMIYDSGSSRWRCVFKEIPAGTILPFGGSTVPDGYLARDGSNISRTTYAALFNEVGTTWGVGDGSTTFGVGDDRRRTWVGSGGSGSGTLGNAVGNTGGAETHTIGTTNLPASGLSIPSLSVSGTVTNVGMSATGGALTHNVTDSGLDEASTPASVTGSTGTGTTGNMGSGNAMNIMQPSAVITSIIKY